jgi:hypothetical protein
MGGCKAVSIEAATIGSSKAVEAISDTVVRSVRARRSGLHSSRREANEQGSGKKNSFKHCLGGSNEQGLPVSCQQGKRYHNLPRHCFPRFAAAVKACAMLHKQLGPRASALPSQEGP